MIPTRYKSKLSHLMSYPINAGTLSKALEKTPQIKELSVAFIDSCQNPHKLENPYRILSIGYTYRRINLTSENKSIEQGEYGAKWEIMVYPVPRIFVNSVKSQLREQGLDAIRHWLYLHQDATGKDGNCWLYLLYDEDTNQLIGEERDRLLG